MRNDFAAWLEEEMQRRGWSQSELAKRAFLNRAVINKILSRMTKPTPETLQAIARALGYPQELVFRKAGLLTDPPPPNHDPDIQLALHLLSNLPPDARREALEFIQFKAQKAQQQQQSRSQPALER